MSDYPAHAQLHALKTCVVRKSEHLFTNIWLDPSFTEEMDKLDRFSVRSMFHLHLPNSVIMSDHKLSSRRWRNEVLMLTGLVRRLGSKDFRVKITALMFTRDAGALNLLPPGPPLDPPFFSWSGTLPVSPPPTNDGVLSYPVLYAWLAHRHLVGIQIRPDSGLLEVTVGGEVLDDPYSLLTFLTHRKDRALLHALEIRQSTNVRKAQAPLFSTSWGLAGKPSADRKGELSFLSRTAPFTGHEVTILLGLRLLLWPTNFRKSILSHQQTPGRCHCGHIQTITHSSTWTHASVKATPTISLLYDKDATPLS
jgi:hypothetical protein